MTAPKLATAKMSTNKPVVKAPAAPKKIEYPVGYKPLHEIESNIRKGPDSWNTKITTGPKAIKRGMPMGLAAPEHAPLEESLEKSLEYPSEHFIRPKEEPEPFYVYERIAYEPPPRTYSPVAPKLKKKNKRLAPSPARPSWNNTVKTKNVDAWAEPSPRRAYIPNSKKGKDGGHVFS